MWSSYRWIISLDNVQYIQNNINGCQRNKTLRNHIYAQSREQYLSWWGLNRLVSDSAREIGFYRHQGIDIDTVTEINNLLIGHIHDKEISVIERWLDINMARKYTWLKDVINELSHVYVYTWVLDLTLVKKELFMRALHSKT
jgi:hypothetical protein